VLKGGVLLAAYDARRPTRDVDIQARAIAGDRDDVLQLVRDIAAGAMDDGLVFDTDAATADIIRDDDDYSGVRVTLTATLASAKLSLHIDVNIGDPIRPTPAPCNCPNCSAGRLPWPATRCPWCTRRRSSPRCNAAPSIPGGATLNAGTHEWDPPREDGIEALPRTARPPILVSSERTQVTSRQADGA
jgi:Nucleotidyl transferase AbiEii toxin, Type IV TA system